MTARLVAATGNPHKLRELERMLADLDVTLVPRSQLGLASPPETGVTFADNALLKARAAVEPTGLPALAEDSGLEVDALDGAPGVRSARYAGDEADDAANNDKLLAALEGVPEDERTARFVAVAVLVAPDGRHWAERGVVEGRVATGPRGSAGFGYDPLFVPTGHRRTTAELTDEEKDALSHRGRALRAIRPVIERFVAGG